MNCTEFIRSSAFATILTLLVSVATCVVSEVQGYRKMKLQYFEVIYNCLEDFTKKRADVIDKCNGMAQELVGKMPVTSERASKSYAKQYDNLYCGINKIISEYSKCLEFYLTISHFTYRYKSLRPIIKAECWELLRVYGSVIREGEELHYRIQYAQIVNLVEFIKIAGHRKDKKALHEYLEEYGISKL